MFTGPTRLCLFDGTLPRNCLSPDDGRLLVSAGSDGDVYDGMCLETGTIRYFRLYGAIPGGSYGCHIQGTAGLYGDMIFSSDALIAGQQVRMRLTVAESRFKTIEVPKIANHVFPDLIKEIWDPLDGITNAEWDAPDPALEAICKDHDNHFWPHKNGCPVCGSDAYVGFSRVECSNTHCQNWFYREGM